MALGIPKFGSPPAKGGMAARLKARAGLKLAGLGSASSDEDRLKNI